MRLPKEHEQRAADRVRAARVEQALYLIAFGRVSEGEFGPGTDALIGMDIITTGDFAITNEGGNTTFTFRVPSLHTIDYADQYQRHLDALAAEQAKRTNGGRNLVNPASRKR